LQTDQDDGMVVRVGLTHVQVKVGNPANGRKSESVRCLVDSGAIYSLGHRGDSMVIVVERGDEPLLGATTLEGFGLVLDPFRRELRPLQLTLKRSA
jgi:hypothetical protein